MRKVQTKLFTILLLSSAAVAVSEDFKTVNGKEYKDATITRVEPDGIVVKTNSGITKVYFTELPKDVQEQFHYDSGKAAAYSAEQAANYTAYQKQQEETRRQQQAADAKSNASLAQQQAATNRIQALQTRYGELQKQEDDLLRQIGQAKQPGARSTRASPSGINQIRKNPSYRFFRVISAMFVTKKPKSESNWKKRSVSR